MTQKLVSHDISVSKYVSGMETAVEFGSRLDDANLKGLLTVNDADGCTETEGNAENSFKKH